MGPAGDGDRGRLVRHRRVACPAWPVALVSTLVACQRPAPADRPAPVPALAPAPREAYVSDLAGVAFGHAFARATADGAPATDTRSSDPDQAVDAAASANGGELARSCRNQGTQSHAQATAAFRPSSVAGVRQFGFTLSTSTYARGGSWREQLVLCRGSHRTAAAADARVTGRVELTFNGSDSASEQLIVRVTGATPRDAHLEVRDGQDQLLPLAPVPGETFVAATLVRPGPYSVRASIAAHAEHDGGRGAAGEQATTVSVSVQSMRDALALGYGEAPASTLLLPLPVFLSTDDMSAALDSVVFTDQHRLYPCAKVDCETDRLRDVYLEMPRVSTEGDAVALDMRLSGSYQIALSFGGGVSGAIRVTALPVVEHDTLRFEAPSIDVATRNVIVKWRAGRFEQMLLDRIRKARIDLTPQLQAAVAKAREHFAMASAGACLLVAPKEAHVRSVQVVTTPPQGILASFGVELTEASASACPKRNATR